MSGVTGLKKLELKGSGNLMPTLFVGHGSPMNIIYKNEYTDTFLRLGQELPKPKAILCVSAHWLTHLTEVTLAAHPKQIFDFHGFPYELYQVQYAPEGSPQLATKISQQSHRVLATNNWGLDHGAWSVLHHMYPNQDIPTLQLSLDQNLSPLEHLQVARQLKFLRQNGVLVLASGNIVHNLRQIKWQPDAPAHSWAKDFEDFVLTTLKNPKWSAEEKIGKIFGSPHLHLAHPSLEHLLPLIYSIGVSEDDEDLNVEVRGIQNAAISMATIRF